MRNFDLIAFDLDGTVFPSPLRQEVTPRLDALLARAHDEGVTVCVASGRSSWMMGAQLDAAPWFDWGVYGAGARVLPKRAASQERLDCPIEQAVAVGFSRAVEALGGGIGVHTATETLRDPTSTTLFGSRGPALEQIAAQAEVTKVGRNPVSEIMAKLNMREVGSISELLAGDPGTQAFKFDIEMPDAETREKAERAAAELGGLEVMVVGSCSLEVTRAGASKGAGVAWLCGRLGIDERRVVAFGDSGNDVSFAGRGFTFVAMGNAADEVKACADDVCQPVGDDGVAQWLDAHLWR